MYPLDSDMHALTLHKFIDITVSYPFFPGVLSVELSYQENDIYCYL